MVGGLRTATNSGLNAAGLKALGLKPHAAKRRGTSSNRETLVEIRLAIKEIHLGGENLNKARQIQL